MKTESMKLSDEDSPSSEDQLEDTSQSEPEEDIDVKVCDICGDAGVEELLAVCSRCSDGAEHTYCMQKKLNQLPEGDWLCEECRYKEKNMNHKEAKDSNTDIATEVEEVKVENLNKAKKNEITDSDPDYAPESDAPDTVDLEENKTSDRPQITSEVDLKTCERASESIGVPTRKVDVKNKSLLSHGDIVSRLGADKNKVSQPAGDLSAKNSMLSRSQTFTGPNSSKIPDTLQSARGTLLKSSSFKDPKMKPKKVQFIEDIPHKKNIGREGNDARRGQLKKNSDPPSFKGIRSSSFKADTTKIQPLNPPPAEDKKERILADKKTIIPPSGPKITDTNKGQRDSDHSGHPTQFGPVDKFTRAAPRPVADRNVKDRLNKTIATKDSSDALILKPNMPKDVRHNNLPEKPSIPSKDIGSSSCLQRTTNKHEAARNLDVTRENNSKPLQEKKPITIHVPSETLRSSAVPELAFIWKGQFEVLKSGKPLRSCEGIQAHLSSFASRKVLQTVTMVPSKIQLEEIAYVNSWPWQCQGRSPKENNIALFFFATDIQSYEKSYSKLLEHMIKYDLALKGSIAGFELLVFPSNKLPPYSQRWNRLFFLWGVFRVKKSFLSNFPNKLIEEPLKANQTSETSISVLPSDTPKIPISQESICNETSSSVNSMHDTEVNIQPIIWEDSKATSSTGPQIGTVSAETTKNDVCMGVPTIEGNNLPHHDDKTDKKDDPTESEENPDPKPGTKRLPATNVPFLDLNENIDFSPADDSREHKKAKHEESGLSSSNVNPYPFLKDRPDIEVINIDDDDDDDDGDKVAPNLDLELALRKPENRLSNFAASDGEDASIDLNLAFHGPKDAL